jgi:flagellar protein FliS
MPDGELTVRDRYLEQMTESANKESLLLMLVDGAANFIRRALVAIERDSLDEVHTCLVKAQNIYMELVMSLDLNAGEFAENLALVYQYIYNLLIEANISKSADKIQNALRLAEEICSLWKETVERSKPETRSAREKEIIVPPVRVDRSIAYEPDRAANAIRPQPVTVDTQSILNITG